MDYKRGDKHPTNPDLFFWRYQKENGLRYERWVNEKQLEYNKKQTFKNGKNHQSKEENKIRRNHRKKIYRSKPETKIKEALSKKLYLSDPIKRQKARENQTRYCSERRKIDILFRLKENMRNRLRCFLKPRKNLKKAQKTMEMLGCSVEFFKKHLESLFEDGMSWDNYGGLGVASNWTLDHIIPLSVAQTSDDLIKLSHYTNIRPCWTIENIKKGNKILNEHKKENE
jgi:hypothetical protein